MADAAANYDQQTADAYYASDAVQKEMRQVGKKKNEARSQGAMSEQKYWRNANLAQAKVEREEEERRSKWAQMSPEEKDGMLKMLAEELANSQSHDSSTSQRRGEIRKFLPESNMYMVSM